MRNTSSPSLWPYLYFVLAAVTSRTGLQVPAEVQVGKKRRLTLDDLKLSTDVSTLKLVLLCGLLAGTSASLLDNLGKDVLRKLKSGLEKGLDNLDSTLETIFQQLKTDFKLPQESTTSENITEFEETTNSLGQLISGIFQVVNRLTGVKIRNVHILDVLFEATSENAAKVRIPITADVNVKLPVLGETIDLALNLVLEFCVRIETDEETGVSQVVVEECKNNQHSISLTVLGRCIGLLSDVMDFVINLVHEVFSLVTHYELCPRFCELLESLDADCLKKLISKSQSGEAVRGLPLQPHRRVQYALCLEHWQVCLQSWRLRAATGGFSRVNFGKPRGESEEHRRGSRCDARLRARTGLGAPG
ncbi:short palate, lung and nasal epithelium carcinoma-associated protein 2A-like [Moschus berezovskii]|uniref:short palate, lung and nasal epithelium carcinoma-associated protein 2A-like n=1 Tax=Moschus berezovskii TaxID=68408 RepID=UPI002443ECE6|nr:short palate, lung and nasal epithelium carcinoma-associated protein 2A-like [Moschus berezovskii]